MTILQLAGSAAMTDKLYSVDVIFGSVKLEHRPAWVPDGDGWFRYGEWRSVHMDEHGRITKVTPWELSPLRIRFDSSPQHLAPRWKFW